MTDRSEDEVAPIAARFRSIDRQLEALADVRADLLAGVDGTVPARTAGDGDPVAAARFGDLIAEHAEHAELHHRARGDLLHA